MSPDFLPSPHQPSAARFPLGQVVATPGALQQLETHCVDVFALLARHVGGDWGEVGAADAAANEAALLQGGRLFSAYALSTAEGAPRVWVISEADRAATTLLLPEEY